MPNAYNHDTIIGEMLHQKYVLIHLQVLVWFFFPQTPSNPKERHINTHTTAASMLKATFYKLVNTESIQNAPQDNIFYSLIFFFIFIYI